MRRESETNRVRRVLIYRLGSLGDTVVAVPCYRLIARAFPDAERWLLTNLPVSQKAPSAREIIDGSGLIDGYINYTVGLRSLGGLLRLLLRLRGLKPDVLVYLAAPRGVKQARRDALFFRACGIRKIIGLPLTEDFQRNRWSEAEQSAEAEAERLARCVAELGSANLEDSGSWDLGLTREELDKSTEVLAPLSGGPLIAVSVGTKMQSKDWGAENWGKVLARIGAEYPQFGLALVGAGSESEASEQAAREWQGARVNLCGKLTPRETAAVLQQAEVFLGHDSGPMHLAAAVETPCVAVFAALRQPGIWFPYGRKHRVIYHRVDCANCGLTVCIEQRKKCLTSVTVDEVLNEVRQQLANVRREGSRQEPAVLDRGH